ncbi:MAG: hypothetical protein HFJ11_02195 [Bacilli bacterium]|nr:hypothetical protein [Bacilli bacterium]
MNYIVGDKEKLNADFGGKANSLLKLVENNFNVPRFYIITSKAYQEFLKFNHIESFDDLVKLKKEIEDANFPNTLEDEIFDYWEKYNFDKTAVRSSASNEDGQEKSFAGQYKTFLNVDKKELLIKIKKCWISLFEDNVVAYSNDISNQVMNVIVQEMVEADYSGVAFSSDPTGSSNNYSVIEVCPGLGEKLVSGNVTPTTMYVRRQTHHSDSITGQNYLTEEDISHLEQIILKIEEIYSMPMDIEWCTKKNLIYILQARAITAQNPSLNLYRKVISREKTIIETEIYYQGEYEGIKSLTKNLYYFKPLFIYDKEKEITNVYYNDTALEEDPKTIYYYMQKDIKKTKELYNKALSSCKYLNMIVDNEESDFNYKEFIKNMLIIYPFTSLGNLAGYFENISSELKELLIDFRNNYDYILYKANEYLHNKAKKILPKEYQEHIKFLFIEEVFQNKMPSLDLIQKRKNGYIFFDNKLELVDNIPLWLERKNIVIKSQQDGKIIKGSVAYSGKKTGKVCQIYTKEDFKKFEKGDILVTTMTTPKFTPILKLAGAIVTDEGGITCHAAIIARELKIPCIIGCKNATEILKNDMIVEVNANEGIINIS